MSSDLSDLFGDLDIASANDEPWAIKADSYPCTVTQSEVKPNNAGDKVGWNIQYTIDEGDYKGMTLFEWKWVPNKEQIATDPMADRARDFLAERMASFGVPKERRNQFKADHVIGTKAIVTVIVKNERPVIRKVVLNRPEEIRTSGDVSGLDQFRPAGSTSAFQL